jgi:hypothetical protein
MSQRECAGLLFPSPDGVEGSETSSTVRLLLSVFPAGLVLGPRTLARATPKCPASGTGVRLTCRLLEV